MPSSDKNCHFFGNFWSDWSENWHAGAQDNFEKRNLNEAGYFEIIFFQKKNKKSFRSTLQYNVAQLINKDKRLNQRPTMQTIFWEKMASDIPYKVVESEFKEIQNRSGYRNWLSPR